MKVVASTASIKINKDARRQYRQPVDVVLSYRTVDQFYCDIATNVSTGGVFVRTLQPLRVGTTLRISFVVPQFGTRVEANGVVVHHGNPKCPGMGIRFAEIDARALKAINELIQHEHSATTPVVGSAEGTCAEAGPPTKKKPVKKEKTPVKKLKAALKTKPMKRQKAKKPAVKKR